MSRIFFKKGGQKPSIFATLGLVTTGLAAIALLVAGPLFRTGLFGDPSTDPSLYDLQLRLIGVSARLIMVAAGFTIAGIIHGRTSSRARASWRALLAAVLTAAMGWPVGKIYYDSQSAPLLHDISTRPEHILPFQTLPERQYDAASPREIVGSRLEQGYQDKLLKAYPGLGSIPFPGSVNQATSSALDAISRRGWNVVQSDIPGGRIEAIYTSPWFGFRSFLVIEVRAKDAVSFLDIRVVSEMGQTDMGTGAKLIGTLQSDILRIS